MQPSKIARSDETDGSSEMNQTQVFLRNKPNVESPKAGQPYETNPTAEPKSSGVAILAAAWVKAQFHAHVLLHLRRFEKRDGGAAQVGEQMEPRNLQITVSHPGENPTHQHQKNECIDGYKEIQERTPLQEQVPV